MTPVPGDAGLEEDPARAEVPERLVRDRHAVERDRKTFFRAWSFPLRMASGTSFALPRPTPTWPGLVADDDERAKLEAPAALDDLGDAVDVDDALLELLLVDLIRTP